MTKGAISNLTLTLAQQLGKRGITVNSLAPGVTDTEINAAWLNEDAKRYLGGQTALGRVGTVEDMAGVAAFPRFSKTVAGSRRSASRRAAGCGYKPDRQHHRIVEERK